MHSTWDIHTTARPCPLYVVVCWIHAPSPPRIQPASLPLSLRVSLRFTGESERFKFIFKNPHSPGKENVKHWSCMVRDRDSICARWFRRLMTQHHTLDSVHSLARSINARIYIEISRPPSPVSPHAFTIDNACCSIHETLASLSPINPAHWIYSRTMSIF